MGIKIIITVLFVAFLLASCAPGTEVIPTEQAGQSSTETSLEIASTTMTAIPEATVAISTPDSHINVMVGSEVLKVTSDVRYSDKLANLNIDSSRAQKIGKVLVYADSTGRFIWNEHLASWTPEFAVSMDYAHPETFPVVPLDAYYDGSKPGDPVFIPSSVTLSDELYLAEHPSAISATATHPYYKVNMINTYGYEISIVRLGYPAFNDPQETKIDYRIDKPFSLFGAQQTVDTSGNLIYVIKKADWNPDASDPKFQIIPTNQGFDKESYEHWIQYPLIFTYLKNTSDVGGELVPLFLPPAGNNVRAAEQLTYDDESPNPHVFALQNQNALLLFPADIQTLITTLYPHAGEKFDKETNPKSVVLNELPPELSNMILYTAVRTWTG